MIIRKAKISDVPEMQKIINSFADKGDLLPRSLNQLYEQIRDFYIMEKGGRIAGTCALHVCWGDLAEVRSLVVGDEFQGMGLGRQLVEACLEESLELGIYRVFALTYRPEFFSKFGFKEVDKSELPQKVWSECIHCVKFPDCGEVAMVKMLDNKS